MRTRFGALAPQRGSTQLVALSLYSQDKHWHSEQNAVRIMTSEVLQRLPAGVRPAAIMIDKSEAALIGINDAVKNDDDCWDATAGVRTRKYCHVLLCKYAYMPACVDSRAPMSLTGLVWCACACRMTPPASTPSRPGVTT